MFLITFEFWMVVFLPPVHISWERLFPWGFWESSRYLINEKSKFILFDFRKRHHQAGLGITHAELKTVVY